MRTSKRKANQQYQSAPTIHSLQLPPTLKQFQQRAHDIYVARGGAENIAASGKFSSDRTIAEYAKEVWNARPCSTE